MRLRYKLTPDARRRAILDGLDPEPDLLVEFVPADHDRATREAFVELDRRGCAPQDRVARIAEIRLGGVLHQADFIAAPETVPALLAGALAALREADDRRDDLARTQAEWIREHGSSHLRSATGPEVGRLYVAERAAVERPGYVPDLHRTARCRRRYEASAEALAEAARVGGEPCWLREPPHDPHDPAAREDARSFEPTEAVRIADWPGGCDLYCWHPSRWGEGPRKEGAA